MNIRNQIIILELNTNKGKDHELKLLSEVWQGPIKHVIGSYNGIKDNAYVLTIRDDREYKLALSIASHFNQECVLYVDSAGLASLDYPSGKNTILGPFKPTKYVSEKESYTYDYQNDTYYIAG